MDTQNTLHENISALADGELPQSEQELAFAALGTAEGQAAWRAYHLTGDVLRDSAQGALSDGFQARLAARLAREQDSGALPYGEGAGQGGHAGHGGRSGHGARGDGGAAPGTAAGAGPATAGASAAGASPAKDQREPRADVILP